MADYDILVDTLRVSTGTSLDGLAPLSEPRSRRTAGSLIRRSTARSSWRSGDCCSLSQAGPATPGAGELAELPAVGAAWARQGIAVDDLVRAWRTGVATLVGSARAVARDLGLGDAPVLRFVESTLAWSDAAMIASVDGHQRAEHALRSTADDNRARFVPEALLGAVPFAELRVHAEVHGLDPTVEYVAVRAAFTPDVAQYQLDAVLGFPESRHNPRGLCALVDGDLAGFFTEPPPGNVDVVVGVGPPRPLERLVESYRLAVRALATARACNLLGSHDISSLALRPAVVMDAEVGEILRQRYLEPLTAGGFNDDLVATLRAYLACGMRVESTAARLFVHHNTVRYRLARFEELTRVSLRETDVLVELWWALELSAMHL